MTFKPHQDCFWLVGRDNKEQAPAVVIDVHDAQWNVSEALRVAFPLVRHQVKGAPMLYRQASRKARAYAETLGIPASRVTFDDDSTELFKND